MTTLRYRLIPGTGGAALVDQAAKIPAFLDAFVSRWINEARTEVVQRTPVGWSGNLRDGYTTELRRRGTGSPIGVLSNPAIYHDPVEEGRKPGKRPPVDALIPWVGSKLGIPPGPERESVAFLIARKIGASGTEPQRMVEQGWDVTRDRMKPALKDLGLKVVKVY